MKAIKLPEAFNKYDKATATVEDIEPFPHPFGGTARSVISVETYMNGVGYKSAVYMHQPAAAVGTDQFQADYFIKKADKFFASSAK